MDVAAQELKKRTSGDRLFQLDALRGIGAVSVLLFHFRRAYNMAEPGWLMRPLVAGPSAVILFFILSGYVLSLPYWGAKKRPYFPYVVRRVCRIYVPFAVAATLSIICAHFFLFRHLPLTGWFYGTWQTPITPTIVLKQFLMWPFTDFNTAFWSLRFEMQLSFLLPLLCLLLRRVNTALVLLCCAALYVRISLLHLLGWHQIDRTIQITVFFLIGIALAKHKEVAARMDGPGKVALGGVGRLRIPLFWIRADLCVGLCNAAASHGSGGSPVRHRCIRDHPVLLARLAVDEDAGNSGA